MVLWYISVVPIMVGLYLLYLIMGKHGLTRQGLIAKCGVTWLCLCTGIVWTVVTGRDPLENAILWGLFFYMIGDAVLGIEFRIGMFSFGVGHIFVIREFWKMQEPKVNSLLLCIGIIAFVAVLFRNIIRENFEWKYVVGLLYIVVLTYMCSTACVMGVQNFHKYGNYTIGSIMFVVSDALILVKTVNKNTIVRSWLILLLYYVGIFLMVL